MSQALTRTGQKLKSSVSQILSKRGGFKTREKARQRRGRQHCWGAKNLSLKTMKFTFYSTFGKLLGVNDAGGQIENIELTSQNLQYVKSKRWRMKKVCLACTEAWA